MWFKTFCILIRSQTLVLDKSLRLWSQQKKKWPSDWLFMLSYITHPRRRGGGRTTMNDRPASWKSSPTCVIKCTRSLQQHTHPFNGPFTGTTRVGRYQKGKTNLDFTEARDSEWQWHQLCHMQVCTSFQTDNHASTPPLSFCTGRMPFLPPNQQCQSTEGTHYSNTIIITTIILSSLAFCLQCLAGRRKSIWTIKIESWCVGKVICLQRDANCLHMVRLKPLPSENPRMILPVTFLFRLTQFVLEKRPLKERLL